MNLLYFIEVKLATVSGGGYSLKLGYKFDALKSLYHYISASDAILCCIIQDCSEQTVKPSMLDALYTSHIFFRDETTTLKCFVAAKKSTYIVRSGMFYIYISWRIEMKQFILKQILSKKISKDQELIQSDPTSCLHNQKAST